MRVRGRTLHPNIADKNTLDKILFSSKFLLPLTLDQNITRISRLVIDESKTVLDSGFHVVYEFLLWQDFSDFGFLFLGDGIRIPPAKDS